MMIKKIAVAATAVLITASPLAFAAETSPNVGMRHLSAADLNALTDARVGIIKAALQLAADARPGKILADRGGGHPRESEEPASPIGTGGGTAR